jgi:hypothetical protein
MQLTGLPLDINKVIKVKQELESYRNELVKKIHNNLYISGFNDYIKEQEIIKNNLAGIITLGCPTAIWASPYQNGGQPCTPKPIYNMWTKSDVLSSPIKTLGQHYLTHPNITDIKVSPGITHWLPTSHNNYWGSNQVYKNIRNIICQK